ncbi:MAG: DUF1972 domain-containing protein [Chloroflexota bacterium]
MRIAFLGTRGIPATYSGFETFVEELGSRLAQRGHEVTVYCRRHHTVDRPASYRGMRLVYVGGIRSKHLDTLSHTAAACLHARDQHYEIAVLCISGNSPLAPLLRSTGARVVLNVDGSDWRRRKWRAPARAYLRLSERLAGRFADVTVTDSRTMQDFYRESLGAETVCIGYGSDLPAAETGILDRLGLTRRGYILLVGRLVPENRADHLVDAYSQLDTQLRCVIVGDAPYSRRYIAALKQRDARVMFPGGIYGPEYRELMHNAYLVVLCSEVGGTHPVLLEAMSAGNCVVVNDTAANLETISDAGIPYEGSRGGAALAPILRRLIDRPDVVESYREIAARRAREHYAWETVTLRYEDLFRSLAASPAVQTASQVD